MWSAIQEESNIKMFKECPITNKEYSVTVPKNSFAVWQNGALIQEVFPDLTAEQREFMISGFTPDEFNEIMSQYDEEDVEL